MGHHIGFLGPGSSWKTLYFKGFSCFNALCSADYCKLKCSHFPLFVHISPFVFKMLLFCEKKKKLASPVLSRSTLHTAPPVLNTTQKHLVVVTQSCSCCSTSSGDQRDSALRPGLNCWHSQVGKGCSHWGFCSGAKLAA